MRDNVVVCFAFLLALIGISNAFLLEKVTEIRDLMKRKEERDASS